ncbi:MAG: hypothetical protein Q4A62_00375 [Eikenella sp.]|nr:hypothetical protein [Eikenella sp.]
MLEEDEKLLIRDFLGENFALFVGFAAERGYSEEEAEQITEKIF